MAKIEISESEKREEIVQRTDLNMFVEAGAGAGKTTLIVKRITQQLKSGVLEPRNIVVITFTNKAAEELRGRIIENIRKEGLTDILSHIDEMNISTIHSFCNVLLKEQSIVASLPQDLELMDESEKYALEKKIFNEYLRKQFGQSDWDRIFKLADDKDIRTIREELENAFHTLCDIPLSTKIVMPKNSSVVDIFLDKFEKILDSNDENYLYEMILTLANGCFKDECYLLDSLEDLLADEIIPSSQLIELLKVMFAEEIDIEELCEALYKTKRLFSSSNIKNKEQKEIYDIDKVKEMNGEWEKYYTELFGNISEIECIKGVETEEDTEKDTKKASEGDSEEPSKGFITRLKENATLEDYYHLLIKYALTIRDYYYTVCPRGKISNNKLLELTRELICSENDANKEALKYFSSKYKCFYVDEFQDTDSMQADFIFRLASDLSDETHESLRDGALFVVGDPKQSIYRFRGAEPQVYFDIKSRFNNLKNAEVYELEKNFRSNGEIIKWVNKVFVESDSITPIVDGDNPYKPMAFEKQIFSNPKDKDKLIHGVYKYEYPDSVTKIGDVKDKNGNNFECFQMTKTDKDADIKAVAEVILGLTDPNNNFTITRYQKNGDEYVAVEDQIKYSDFLLISHVMPRMKEYLEEFNRLGIPVHFDGKMDINTDRVLRTFVRIYKNLVNPREPMFRMAAIEAIRVSGLIPYVNGEIDEEKLVNKSKDLLNSLYESCKHMSPYGKAEFLEKQISVLFEKNKDIGALEIKAEQTHIRQMLEHIYSNVTGTGIELAEKMEEYLETKLEREMQLEEVGNAVRFMNLHKSKGLEGNIVIMLDRRGLKSKSIADYREGDLYYPGIKRYNGYNESVAWSSVKGIKHIENECKLQDAAEFHRLEYVAVTRAEQAVIFMDVINPRGLFATTKTKDKTINKNKNKVVDDVKSYDYNIRSCASIKDLIGNVNSDYVTPKAKSNRGFDKETYGLIIDKKSDKKYNKRFEKQSPSMLEKKSVPEKEKYRKQAKEAGVTSVTQKSTTVYRPLGNIIGNVLHRTMELMLDRYEDGLDETGIDRLAHFCATVAVNENHLDVIRDYINSYEDLGLQDGDEQGKVDTYKNFAKICAKAYYKYLVDSCTMNNIDNVFTELPFSYYTTQKAESDENEDEKIWMNGTADLILTYKDGRVLLIDYKSDNDYFLTEENMDDVLTKKYTPQLTVYKGIIENIMSVKPDNIEVEIISFSQKDKQGRLYSDDTVRVRCTKFSIGLDN